MHRLIVSTRQNRKKNGTGGYTSIVSGGVWHNNFMPRFESQFPRGFYFMVKIYVE